MGKAVALVYPTHGHIAPALGVVEELVRRGEEVTFYATPRARKAVEETGARFRAYGPDDQAFNPDPPTDGLFSDMARLLALTESMLPDLIAQVAAEAPDYLLFDTKSVWGRLVSQVLDLPAVTHPMTIFGGAEDEMMISGKYAETVQAIRPSVDVKLIEGVNHMGMVTNPKAVNAIAEDVATRGANQS